MVDGAAGRRAGRGMMRQLACFRAVITGAGRGLGAALVLADGGLLDSDAEGLWS